MKTTIARATRITKTPRVLQMSGMFDLPPAEESRLTWDVDLPIESRDWRIGLIVGPSGCGKSTIAREMFPGKVCDQFDWPQDQSVLDGFPASLGIKEISALLSSVGFSSPPSWLRPFGVLSTGEQFRVTVARALAESPDLVVIDEFTSVVDRTVAKIGSSAIAKAVRGSNRRLIAVGCHYDVMDWLQPDWTYQPANGEFAWRSLQPRPEIPLEIARCGRGEWRAFKNHHYLSGELTASARCFVGRIDGREACFGAVNHFPHPKSSGWKEHRFVVLPDYQGVGLGNRLSEYIAALFASTGKPYRGVTSHPAYVHHRLRSPLWKCLRKATMKAKPGKTSTKTGLRKTISVGRLTWSFEYIGPTNLADAKLFDVVR